MIEQFISFRDYKSAWTLCPEDDLFIDTEQYGCHEDEFEKWLKSQRLFIKRFAENCSLQLSDMVLPEKKWGFFTERFEREMHTHYLVNLYPDGFFEAVNDSGEVACFLPEPSSKYEFRISYYRDNGPTYHECYNSRFEALSHMAHYKFKPEDGALDRLVHTDKWNRGLQVAMWLYEGINPHVGLQRDRHIPEIQHLFSVDLQLND
ncbi:hypothetical protein VA249_45290 (plasmid) [Vibrio alfacsensis]|uniref:hypothetical protein n=1 Tax=Vibrio alfacsensis TaxID=1074311 RepID=UPI001BF0C94F|nr:hypothetical protein [Vibrio alfacsensis]BBM67883.1 hypothetical protein VA249_45290 [Vibrio alfacsensis]